MDGGGQPVGRGAGGKVCRGNAVKRRRMGEGSGSQGRGEDMRRRRNSNEN